MQEHDELVVAEVNERFYAALESSDLGAMEALWLDADWVKCVHPGWQLIVGRDNVIESWRQIFANSTGMRVSTNDVSIRIFGEFAWVSCTENLAIFLDSSSAPLTATTTATNLFQLFEGSWLLVHHHASPTPNAETIAETDTIQ